jgi:hypothetical protein
MSIKIPRPMQDRSKWLNDLENDDIIHHIEKENGVV